MKTITKVFITKTNKFRIKIDDGFSYPYEVTVNGKEWKKGRGQEYKAIIKMKIESLLSKLNEEYKEMK